ncbi:MAG: GNAT family N-acetyltransferase [Candidatus Aenigmarchaeota archaeon]|nr:GNAT family N-acetyltransferase [Candidatus Aenigmarchaeota archaeon]
MNPGKILEKRIISGKSVVFRYPKLFDAKGAMETINSQVEERADIAKMTKVTLQQEKKWVSSVLKAVKGKEKVFIAIEAGGQYAGSCEVTKDRMESQRHVGTLGIGLRKEIRSLGIGKRAMRLAIREAKKIGVTIVRLDVYNTNKVGQRLYKKLGFHVTGKIKNLALHYGKRKDGITMVKYL